MLSFRIQVLSAAAIAASLATAAPAVAEPTPLRGDALSAIVPGAHIELDTPLSTVIPIRFTPDGLMTGEANGLGAYLGSERDRGRWRVADDKLCLKWFRWFDAEERCLNLQRQDQRIFWQESGGESGTATLVTSGEDVARATTRFAIATAGGTAAAPAPAASEAPKAAAAPEKPTAAPPVPPSDMANAGAGSAAPPPSAANLANLSIISRAEAATPPETPPDRARIAKAVEPAPAKAKSAKAKPQPAKKVKTARADKRPAGDKTAGKQRTRVSSAAPASGPAYQVAYVEEDDVLNIRNGPSEEHDMIGAIPPDGRGVRIVGPCRADWCPIAHGDAKGWVNRYYLMAEEPSAQSRDVARRQR